MQTFDLIVVGAGTSGLAAAEHAASLGARVLLVERSRPGGREREAVNAALAFAAAGRHIGRLRAGPRLGFDSQSPSFRWTRVMASVRERTAALPAPPGEAELLARGITLRSGEASFRGPGRLGLGEEVLAAKRIVLAPGARPKESTLGVETLDPLGMAALGAAPRSVLFVGTTPWTLALAQALARLGPRVEIVAPEPTLLPGHAPETAGLLAEALAADGVRLHLGARVESVRQEAQERVLVLDGAAGAGFVRAQEVLLARSHQPDLEALALAAGGVETVPPPVPGGAAYLRVDDRLRTTAPGVWAAGRACGEPCPPELARHQGMVAAENALTSGKLAVHPERVLRLVPTDPELAAVGDAGDSAAGPPGAITSLAWFAECASALHPALADARGCVRLVADRTRRPLAFHAAGEGAGEAAALFAQAMRSDAPLEALLEARAPVSPALAALALAAERLRGPRRESLWSRLTQR